MQVHPRAQDYVDSLLSGLIENESELTAGVKIEPGKRYGFFTDTTLCIGCKACEVACKEWNNLPADGMELTGDSYDNTKDLSSTTWRHVSFIEKISEIDNGERATVMPPFQSNWLMMSDVCKHCSPAPCLESCPTGSLFRTEFDTVVVQPDICNGCGYCVPACPFGVVETNPIDGKAHKCTLCYDRLKGGLRARLRQSLSDRFHPVRRIGRPPRTGGSARRAASRNGPRRCLSLRRSRRAGSGAGDRSAQCVLSADGPPGDLQPADCAVVAFPSNLARFVGGSGDDGRFCRNCRRRVPYRESKLMNQSFPDPTKPNRFSETPMEVAEAAALNPYGRSRSREEMFRPDGTPLPAQAYHGETYYDRPALKPTHYGKLISSYFFAGGLAGGAQLLASIADLFGGERDRSIVRNGRYLALAGSLASPVLLIADLETPERWFNMLRIVRPTSAMSLGSWTLFGFGTSSGLAAAAQLLEDLTGVERWRPMARMAAVPATALSPVMATYTGSLIGSTSNPLWASVSFWLPVLFGTSAASTALAALTLGEHITGNERNVRNLETLSLISGAVEGVAISAIKRQWESAGVEGPMREQPTKSLFNIGVWALGVAAPLIAHGVAALTGRRSRQSSLLAAAGTLAGGFLMRHLLVKAGNESARRPRDYFRFAQPPGAAPASFEEPLYPSRPSSPPEHPPKRRLPPPETNGEPPAAMRSFAEHHQEAQRTLQGILDKPPLELRDDLDRAEVHLVAMRDEMRCLIRQEPNSPAKSARQNALSRVNVALSLVSGVEYPVGGIQRSSVEQARDVLADVLLNELDLS